jgi:nucleoside-diphosphate-sugar epimerase
VFDAAPPPAWAAAPAIEYVQGDVRDRDALNRATTGADVIVHAAFASPRQRSADIRAVNLEGTANAREAARQNHVSRIVLVSSTIVTGPPRPHPFWSESPLSRLDLYRTTRIEAERMLTETPLSGSSVAVVRPQSFLGPGRLGAFGIIFELIRTGEPVPILGGGGHRYQLLGVQDLAEGIRLLTARESQGVFAFGARTFSTVRDDLQALLIRVHSGSTLRHVPAPIGRASLKAIELAGFVPLSEWHRHSAWQRDSVADCTRAEQELGWAPRLSNVDALAGAYDWYAATVQSQGSAPRTHPLPRAHAALKHLLRLLPRS